MKNIVKALITATGPAALIASAPSPRATQAQDIHLCDITGSHLKPVSALPSPAAPAPPPPAPPLMPMSGARM